MLPVAAPAVTTCQCHVRRRSPDGRPLWRLQACLWWHGQGSLGSGLSRPPSNNLHNPDILCGQAVMYSLERHQRGLELQHHDLVGLRLTSCRNFRSLRRNRVEARVVKSVPGSRSIFDRSLLASRLQKPSATKLEVRTRPPQATPGHRRPLQATPGHR
jgi:hypothetical protein